MEPKYIDCPYCGRPNLRLRKDDKLPKHTTLINGYSCNGSSCTLMEAESKALGKW